MPNFGLMNGLLVKKYFSIAAPLSVLISLTIHVPLLLSTTFDAGKPYRGGRSFDPIFTFYEIFITIAVSMAIYGINYYLIKPLESSYKLRVLRIFISIAWSLVAAMVVLFLSGYLRQIIGLEPMIHRYFDDFITKNLFAWALVLISIYIIRLIFVKQAIEVENEQLKVESIQGKFDALKNQLSPHFLFNSLTALKTLIQDSPDTAGQYVTHLSQVLRYSLTSNRHQLSTLREELDFIQSYMFMYKLRYGSNLNILINIPESLETYSLPPLTLQILVENAIKHNEISKHNPLVIEINPMSSDALIISNRIQEKLTPEEGTGIGLLNLSKLFTLLGKYELQVIRESGFFKVIVPLIKNKSSESFDN
jgi:LytS/YehU family sensor histidine kinase